MFQKEWHGIDLITLPGAFSDPTKPASAEFYAQFYAALESGQGKVDEGWLQAKQNLGEVIETHIIAPWKQQHGRSPRILALGAGKAFAERIWYEHGHTLTFHECQAGSLEEVQQACPKADLLIGSFEGLTPDGRYDLITMLTIDYVMNRAEFTEFLSRAGRWLTDDGQLIIYCASTLCLRQFGAEMVKRLLGRYRNNKQVFWGYWRSPNEFFRIAPKAALRVADVYRFGNPLKKAGWFNRKLPPLRDTNLIVTMSKASHRFVSRN
ncbi:MAG TPA: hypothetical protein VH255_01255 [Verrucomicrobiae bacterium]|nr:hypothetical protein [Verrucomicrobiae bacterium]